MPTGDDPRIVLEEPWRPRLGGGATRSLSENEQLVRVTTLMNDIYRYALPTDDPMHLDMTPTQLDLHDQALESWADYVPDLVSGVSDALKRQYGFSPADTNTGGNSLAADVFNRIISTAEHSTEHTTTTQTTDRESTSGTDRQGSQYFERTTGRKETRYVDVPTPDEFLNDFQTSLSTYVHGLKGAGQIDQTDADFLLNDPSLLFDSYMADLGARASRGEDIFKVVGATGTPVDLGTRAGDSSIEEYSGMTRDQIYERIVSTQHDQIEENIRSTISSGQTQTDAAGNALPFTTEQEQQVQQETDRQLNELTNNLMNEQISQSGKNIILTQEEVLSRPHLTTIFANSPLAFLQSTYDPQKLQNLVAGRRGTRQEEQQTARGVVPSAPRRVGG